LTPDDQAESRAVTVSNDATNVGNLGGMTRNSWVLIGSAPADPLPITDEQVSILYQAYLNNFEVS
jgi:hypothetical protein